MKRITSSWTYDKCLGVSIFMAIFFTRRVLIIGDCLLNGKRKTVQVLFGLGKPLVITPERRGGFCFIRHRNLMGNTQQGRATFTMA